jgi:antitoxin PrlF
MEISRITSKGQITIPVEIRRRLKLKTGDKVVFIEDGERIIFANSAMIALKEFQQVMRSEAERQGLHSEIDLNQLVKEVRRDIGKKKYANHD